jgi:hypothetical protein
MAILLYDRDTSAGSSIPLKTWPAGVNANRPDTWGGLRFGVPAYQAPPSNPGGTLLIRQGENGASVVDGEVGGGTTCGNGLDFWNEWGDTPAPGGSTNTDFNIQNQGNIADWPCFSKVFINFPLGAIPPGKVIRSARLVLHEFGSSDPANAKPSYIQVLAVADNWDEASLTWNNAPLAVGNFVGAWVDPTTFPGWPGIRYEWDVSLQTSQAYAAGDLLRLALYSADGPLHSGKYFVSSHTGDWNKEARPTLIVEWGNP